MKLLITKFPIKFLFIIYLLVMSLEATAKENVDWEVPNPVFKQNFDWVKLTSNEWLKGDIISMYDEVLEFESEELDTQTIDWDDVAELRSQAWQSIRMFDGTIAEGNIVLKEGKLSLTRNGKTTYYALDNLLSIASSGEKERDLWDGYVNLGINLRSGNTAQVDYTFAVGVQRRSASSRLKADFTTDYSRYTDQDTDEVIVTADSQRLTTSFDWFFHPKVYFRATDFEYIADEFLNLDYRLNYGIGFGYHLIDTSRTSWDINAGPSYQVSNFIDVQETESDTEKSLGLMLGTDFTFEVTSDIDYDLSYSVQLVGEASGGKIHHFETGLEIELTSDFDLDLMLYADHTNNPKQDSNGVTPEKTDYRTVISLSYDM